MRLPRHGFSEDPHVTSGTADWASEAEILARAYKPGDIWLGRHLRPTPRAAAVIERLEAFEIALRGETALNPAWLEQQLGVSRVYREKLGETDHVEIGISDDRHAVSCSGSRGGKGTSAIINNLCLYSGSVIAIDPKGENTRLCLARRGAGSAHCDGLGQTVVVLDPYGVTGVPEDQKSAWNPIDALELDDRQLVDRAAGLADALMVRSKAEDAHFDDSARIFVKALILFVAFEYAGRDDRNLVTVHDLLMNGAVAQLEADIGEAAGEIDPAAVSAFEYLLELMRLNPERADGVICGAANMLLGMGDKERGGVLSTARRNLEFLERRGIRETLVRSTFDLDALKTDPKGMTIFLSLPPHRMHDAARFLRIVIGGALERMYETNAKPATGYPVLFLLEEFASLKHMEIIEHAVGYAAGFGVKFWIILQDITQLKRFYKESWETFLGNAGIVQAFANSDYTTLDYLSKKIGQTEISQIVRTMNRTRTASANNPSDVQMAQGFLSMRTAVASMFDAKATGKSASISTSDAQQVKLTVLIQPDEIERYFRREEMTEIVLIKGERPFALTRQNYFDGWRFLGLFEPDRAPYWSRDDARKAAQQRKEKHVSQTAALIEEAERWMASVVQAIEQARAKQTRTRA